MLSLFTVMYGNNPLYELELFGSMLSAFNLDDGIDNIEVTVFSDRDNIKDFPFPVRVIKISSAEWDEWTYNGTATHFIKMHAMQKMLSSQKGPVLYFDTDIIFMAPPSSIINNVTSNKTLMHACEGPIRDHAFWNDFLNQTQTEPLLSKLKVKPDSLMYNSGIMGMLPEHGFIMREAMDLAREIYQREAIFSIDQLCTGTALSHHTTLGTCENEVFHYWGWKRPFIHIKLEEIRSRWMSKTLIGPALTKALLALSKEPKIHLKDKLKSNLHPSLKNSPYHFAFLAYYCSQRYSVSNPRLANVWAMTCFNIFLRKLHTGIGPTISPTEINFLNQLSNHPTPWLNQQALEALQKIYSLVSTKNQ